MSLLRHTMLCILLKISCLFIFKLRVKYKSQSMVPSLNHRHRKNKILVLSLWIPEMSFVSLYHIYTVVFIYCCRKISLKYLTASYNPQFHPETNTLKILWQKQNKKYPTNPKQALTSPHLNCTAHPVSWRPLCFWRQLSCFNISETTFLILPCFLRKSNGQRAFSSKQYI